MHGMPPRWEKAPVLFEASVRTISAWRCFACNPKKEQAIIFPKTATMQTTLAVRKTLAWTRPGTCGIWDTKTTCPQSGFRPRMKAAAFPDGMMNCPEILTERLPVRNKKDGAVRRPFFISYWAGCKGPAPARPALRSTGTRHCAECSGKADRPPLHVQPFDSPVHAAKNAAFSGS